MNRRQRRTQWQAARRHAAEPSLAPAPSYASIRMQVGELVLRGFDRRLASRIAAAFEQSLSNRLSSATPPAPFRRPMRTGQLRLEPLRLRRPTDVAAIGDALARSVLALRTGTRRGGKR